MPSEPEIISLLAHLPTTVSERDRLTTQVDSRANHFAAIVFSGLSVIAVLPVPYLTLRSISFLVTQQSDLTFNQMMHSDNSWFWFFGPLTAGLATLAIVPFNMYNAYKIVQNVHCQKSKLTLQEGLKTVLQGGLVISGAVNGYNMSVGFNDIFKKESLSTMLAHHAMVTIAVLFAGASDARVVTKFLFKEMPRDLRYIQRGVNKIYKSLRANATNHSVLPLLPSLQRRRKHMLQSLQAFLDDLGFICQLGLSAEQVNHFGRLFAPGLSVREDEKLLTYFALLKNDFPAGRFIGAEVLGSVLSGVWAYFGNLNVLELANNGIEGFLKYSGLSDGFVMRLSCVIGSYTAYMSSALLSFFLIRDLFFRECFKKESVGSASMFAKRIFLPSLPALSYGLLNVILTFLNTSLDVGERMMVAFAAVIGATVVSRYGIDNGIREMEGTHDLRRVLVNIAPSLMIQFQKMDDDELLATYNHIKDGLRASHTITEETAEDIRGLGVQVIDDGVMSLTAS